MQRHPEHDAVSREVKSWYTSSAPEIGLSAVEAPYGQLTYSDRTGAKRLLLTVDAPGGVATALAAASEFYKHSSFEVRVDDRARAERLTDALWAAGWRPAADTVVLALVGELKSRPGPPGLTIEEVLDVDGLRQWAAVKLRGFGVGDRPTADGELETELAVRQAEWPISRYRLAHVDGQAVAILGHYTGPHQMVFLLTTRLPFRHQGIAQAMLADWTRRAEGENVRSLLINCDEGGRPFLLYRRLGFTDEVYWHRGYQPIGNRSPSLS
jgi:hypothetical protein